MMEENTKIIAFLEAKVARQDKEIELLKLVLREIRRLSEEKDIGLESAKLEDLENQLNDL